MHSEKASELDGVPAKPCMGIIEMVLLPDVIQIVAAVPWVMELGPNSRGACAIGYIASRFHGLRSVSFLLPPQAALQLCRPMVGDWLSTTISLYGFPPPSLGAQAGSSRDWWNFALTQNTHNMYIQLLASKQGKQSENARRQCCRIEKKTPSMRTPQHHACT